jgi:hypothetical protein
MISMGIDPILSRKVFPAQDAPPPHREWWDDLLRLLFPLEDLLNRPHPGDPVHNISLPDARPAEDASMISAYYLSFYE